MPFEIHHFAYGWFNPALALVLAFAGSLTGLVCTVRARDARSRARRARWLMIGSLATGGAGIWLVQLIAMLGFDIAGTTVRYDPGMTFAGLAPAVAAVACGLFLVGTGPLGAGRLVVGGLFTASGIVAMHFTGMHALRIGGEIGFDRRLVLASALIAVAAAVAALWLAVWVRGWRALLTAAGIMSLGVCGMHYTAMAAMRVHLDSSRAVSGLAPTRMVVPIFLVAAVALLGLFVSALQAMTQEEFDHIPPPRTSRAPLLPGPRADAESTGPRS